MFSRKKRAAQCATIEKKGHAGKSLHWSDEQLHQRLPAALGLGLVDLQNQRARVTACSFDVA